MSAKIDDYRCNKCEYTEEMYTDKEVVKCPKCKKVMFKVPNFGGYKMMGANPGSTKSKYSGYRKPKQ